MSQAAPQHPRAGSASQGCLGRASSFRQPCMSPQEAVSERKSVAKQKAILQQQTGKLSELEEAAQERAQYLLQRASRMRMEQEDEIKEFSEVGPGAPRHHRAPQGLLLALRPA